MSPEVVPFRGAAGETGQHPGERLVCLLPAAPHSARLEDQARPVAARVVGSESEAEQRGTDQSAGRHERRPEAACRREVDDEDRRRQLDRGGKADQHALRRAAVQEGEVCEDERQDDEIDLAVVEGGPDRFEQGGRGAGREGDRPGQARREVGAREADAGRDRDQQGAERGQCRGGRAPCGSSTVAEGRHEEGGKRRVGERQDPAVHGVEGAAVQEPSDRPLVGVEVDHMGADQRRRAHGHGDRQEGHGRERHRQNDSRTAASAWIGPGGHVSGRGGRPSRRRPRTTASSRGSWRMPGRSRGLASPVCIAPGR